MGRALIYGNGKIAIGHVHGRPVYPVYGADNDGDDNDSSGTDDTGGKDDDDDGSSEEDDDPDDDKDDTNKGKRKDRAAHNSTNAMRRELGKLRKAAAEREKADREAELKTKSDVDRAVAEREDLQKKIDDLQPKYQNVLTELEIIKASGRLKLVWNDLEDVLSDKTLRKAIETNEDGELEGVDEALKDLAKRKKHFLASKKDDSDEDSGRNNNGKPRGSTGANVGNGGGKKDNRTADRERLEKSYPALARLTEV